MKTNMFVVLLFSSALTAGTAAAQPAPFNEIGVTMGHWHIASKDAEANKKLFLAMGGKLFMPGGNPLIMFPGLYINVNLGTEKGDGGTVGSVVNHVGFIVDNVQERVAQWKAAGVAVLPGNNNRLDQAFVVTPDGVRMEILEDRTQSMPIRGEHVHLSLSEAEIPKAQAWYAKTFGGKPGTRNGAPVVNIPGVQIRFASADAKQAVTRGRVLDHIGFDVKDHGAFVKKLEADGIKLDEPVRKSAAGSTITYITDPWGTRIEIVQRAPLGPQVSIVSAQEGPAQFSREWYQQFSGPYSAPVEPFRIVGNIYYVGAANIASYLITTPQGHILIDTGMNEMHDVIKNSVAKLGFKTSDIKIMLSSHAHFDHVEGHAAMKRLTGAQVMAMRGDVEALESGKDNSALGAVGWEPVQVDRVLKHNDTVTLGGTTLRALHTPGHTQGATTWITTVEDKGRRYTVGVLGGTTPNAGVPLFNNPRHRNVIEDTQRTFKILRAEKVPDIYLPGHPQAMFAGKVERIKAGETPHPLLNGDMWTKQITDGDANFQKRVAEERAKLGR